MSLKERQLCLKLIDEAISNGARQRVACEAIGLCVRTLERWRKNPQREDQRMGPKTPSARALTPKEKEHVLNIANSPEYRDLTPHNIVAKLADQKKYIASERTFYRILAENKLLTHRHRSKVKSVHPPRALAATKARQVWSWDISFLPTTVKGRSFYLYFVLDIFSRYIAGFRVEEEQSSEFGAELMARCYAEQKIKAGELTLHSDNGGPMVGSSMLATLYKLGVDRSRSRPAVSNDNPYSEALFKTAKYCPLYPQNPFATVQEARAWADKFVQWYNEEHYHSEIRYVKPKDRHLGLDGQILYKRLQVYEEAKKRNPLRWSGACRNWSPIEQVYLNPNKEQKEAQLRQKNSRIF